MRTVDTQQGESKATIGNKEQVMIDSMKKQAIETMVCAMVPEIDRSRVRAGIRLMAGECAVAGTVEVDDRPVSRKEAAQMLGVCPATVSLYVRRGLIRPIRFGVAGARASGYSVQSIKAAMAMAK